MNPTTMEKQIEMKTTKMSTLERRVFGNNRINAYTIENLKKVLPQLTEHLNKKIEIAGGARSAKFIIELLDVPYIPEYGQIWRTYLSFEHGELFLVNDITLADKEYEGGGYGVSYYKNRVRIAKVENGILKEIYTLKNIIKSYDLKKVYDWKKVAAMKKELERLQDRAQNLEWIIKRATGN